MTEEGGVCGGGSPSIDLEGKDVCCPDRAQPNNWVSDIQDMLAVLVFLFS